MECLYRSRVELEQGLSPGADYHPAGGRRRIRRPLLSDRLSQLFRRGKLAATRAIGAHKVGIAEVASRARPIALPPRPQVTPRKTTEDRRPAGVHPFALESVVDLFDGVAHRQKAGTGYREQGTGAADPASGEYGRGTSSRGAKRRRILPAVLEVRGMSSRSLAA